MAGLGKANLFSVQVDGPGQIERLREHFVGFVDELRGGFEDLLDFGARMEDHQVRAPRIGAAELDPILLTTSSSAPSAPRDVIRTV